MKLERRRQAMFQIHASDQQVNCLLRCDLYYKFGGSWREGSFYQYTFHYLVISIPAIKLQRTAGTKPLAF